MEEDTEYVKLPVEERCVHKVWKARVHGYEEATKLFRQTSDEKSPEFNKFLGLVKKFVIDSNAVAQEKGLEATLAYVENAAVAGRTVGEVISGIVNKCIAAPKTKTKELSLQIILMYIEIEKQDVVLEELLKGCDHKTPKNVAACVNAITCGLREFGEKVIAIKPLLKKCPSILEHKDKAVRDEGKALMVEMFRWIGPALRPQLSSLKPVQVTELEAEFEKLKGERATPQRYLKSQQARQAEVAAEQADAADGDGGGESGDEAGPDIDPLDLLDPVDILSKLPKNFYEKVEEKKWQERKEALDTLEKSLTESPKLEAGDYADLVKVLKKLITKDSNVVIVGVACKCLALLVTALKKKFHPYAGAMLPACLEKFKEKKQNVVTPLRDAVDAIFVSTTLEAIVEDVLTALDNKNPQVKAESIAFLGRCFTKCTPVILNKKLLKTYVTALLKTLNEPDPTVRENSMVAIGTAMKVVGEKAIGPFLEDVNDANKMTKIKEYCDKAVLCVKQPKAVKERPTTAPGKSASSGNVPKVIKAGGAAGKVVKSGSGPQINSATMTRKPAPGSKVAKAASGGGASKSSSSSKLGPNRNTVPGEKDLSDEEVEEKASELLPPSMVSDLTDANWKTRLAAMEQLLPVINDIGDSPGTAQVLIRILNKKPGFKDNNFQVLKLRLECVKVISEKFKITSTTVGYCLTDIAAYLGDTKNGALAGEVLTSLAEATRLDFVSSEVLNFAFSVQKSPKVQQEALTWLSGAILEFGFVVEPKSLMENVKKAVAASNPQVRTACISLLGTLYLYMGRNLNFFFENEKPALVQQINAEFEKHEGETPPIPTRGISGGGKSSEDVVNGEEEELVGQATDFNIEDVMPRVDISGQITEALLSELSDKNWKVKAEALGKIQAIIQEARFITPNLGEAPTLIAARLIDSNSKIGAAAVALVECIAPAMGGPCRKYVRAFFPNLLQGMGDSKTWIRSSAVSCINKWGETCGFKDFFEGEMITDALKSGSPILRAELWSWLATTLPEVKTVPKEELHACLLILYNNLEDRNADVRKNAADAVAGFMIHVGFNHMNSACEKLKPASSQTVKTMLDKTRGTVPDRSGTAEKASKPKSSGAAGAKQGQKSGSAASGGSAGGSRPSTVNSATMSRSKSKTNIAPAKSNKKEEDIDLSPLLQVNSMKHQRVIDESKLKILKWNFTTPREEFVELLKDQMMTSNVNKTLIANMFHPDFKYHLKAIESLNEDLQHNIQALTCNLDLILKWMTLRFFDTNPSVLLKGLEYLNNVLEILVEENYKVSEQEASSFFPYLILKIGDPKDTVRASVRQLFRLLGSVYPLARLFTYVMDGIKSKNARQRAECLDVCGWLVETYGATVIPQGALKEIAKQIADRDNSVRSAALNCIVQVHYLMGDKIFRQIGQISDKDMSLLEERIKRASKTKRPPPIATVKPTPSPRLPIHTPRPVQPQEDTDEDEYNEEDEREEEGEMEGARSDPRGFTPNHSILRNPLSRLPQASRPISGPYTLDMALIESIERDTATPQIRGPHLKEFDLAYLKDPVPMPSSVQPTSVPASQARSNMSTTLSNHGNINIFNTLEQISSQDSDTALRAMQQVETLIVTDKWSQLAPHVDMLVRNMVAQLDYLRQTEQPDLVNCYRGVFSLCMKLYNVPPLCEKITEDPINQILNQLLLLLSEKNSVKQETLLMVLKVMNSLALRILERSDHTASVCATFRVLFDGVKASVERPSLQTEHFLELAWKCMWKVIKYFPEWDSKLDYVRILAEAHAFLKTFPSSWWRSQAVTTPLRTVKTVIHSMARNRKSDLVVYLKQVPGVTEDCELYYYVHKMQQQFKSDDSSKPAPFSVPQDASERLENGNTASSNIRVSKANADALADIFKKIGNKDDTHEGLRLLYKWKQDHPEQPLDLTQYSQVFQDYIKKGMKNIELEMRCEQSNKENKRDTDNNMVANSLLSGGSIASSGAAGVPDDESEDSKVAYYSRRLRDLQMRAGLVAEPGSATTPTKTKESEVSDLEQLQNMSPQRQNNYKITSPENLSNVERLRQRLEKLKQPSNS